MSPLKIRSFRLSCWQGAGRTITKNLRFIRFLIFCDPFGYSEHDENSIFEMTDKFRRLGIKTIFEFENVALSELPSRLGSIAILCKERLKKSAVLTWPDWRPKEIIEERLEFSYDDYCGSVEPLLFKTKTALDRIFSRLKGRG